jgi:nucleoside-diphosphate kinase
MERTLILIKPDAYARGLAGELIARFERKGLRPVAARVLTMTPELAEAHYAEHVGKPFFPKLAAFIASGPLFALVFEGRSAVAAARQLIGATDPLLATPGSIRGDFGIESARNLVHGSDSGASAVREIELFFPELSAAAAAAANGPALRTAQLV